MNPVGMKESDYENYKYVGNYVVTARKPEHYFRKYNSFGISESEIEKFPENITHVLIVYFGKRGKKYYLSELKHWKNGKVWNNILRGNKGDSQRHVPVQVMDEYENSEDVPDPKLKD